MLHHSISAPAGKVHLTSFLTRLEAELDACGFLRNAEMRPSMVRNIRALFGRAELTDQELRTLHGILTRAGDQAAEGLGRRRRARRPADQPAIEPETEHAEHGDRRRHR